MNRASFRLSLSRSSPCMLAIVGLLGAVTTQAGAQSSEMPPPQRVIYVDDDDRSGPRIGVAYLYKGSVTAEMQNKKLNPLTTLFGWQFEHRFDAGPDLPSPLAEFIVLVGGLEQNTALPSASFMLGFRQLNGVEFGVGPTITGAGTQVAFAAGITHQFGRLNVPVNFAVAPGGQRGVSYSLTAGFNYK